ncbi:putative pentatricopeptide repeat-containing protein At3g01580 [Arabidopsis lyrata subsp. lyrata]|uniref:putative pentatricopeptide repeat-containing protein At3g01580 n=1 Tax=Arabidopsis lyrata subsp. lyrata TaxID=81972 RepID=UPI000A29A7CB|nr:putative pentatricopeptide repeat-containing protein At3g01580 [Arabidopsis lyrata subsp. lyrata]|eukprot:XP_020887461.1 putative pentatricopeptide repeat-containing protein At3g01580 [Arabidopsis lyrata subsp. lyrata]
MGFYRKFSSSVDARQVFGEMTKRTLYQWNTLLKSLSRDKHWEQVMCHFSQMFRDEEKPDNFTLPVALKACGELREVKYGEMIHGFLKKNVTLGSDLYVGSSLIYMYVKCGRMTEALRMFNELEKPDIVTWSSMVSGFEKNGSPYQAVEFFRRMATASDVTPDRVTLITLVSACTKLSNSRLGRCVHGFVMRRGFSNDLSLVNSLLNCYAKSRAFKEAVNLFKMMAEKDVISWSTVIACYVQNGAAAEALRVFNEMIDDGTEPNVATVLCVLQACAAANDLEQGRKTHELAIRKGLETEVKVSTALVDMYMKCFSPEEAYAVFSRIPKKDVVSWVALISGFTLNGMAHRSIEEFSIMLLENNTRPDAILMLKVLGSCSELGFLKQAECFHSYVIKYGFDSNPFIGASLVELYSRCGSLGNASKVFNEIALKDTVVWTSLITGYGIHGKGTKALETFNHMVRSSEVKPNEVTFLSILSACSHAGLIHEGLRIFELMVNDYRLAPNLEHYAVLVDLLGRVGELDTAIEITKRMPFSPTPQILGTLLGACRIHQNGEMAETVAKQLFELESNHAGYYMLMSNMYGVKGEWENVEKLRNSVKQRGIKKGLAESLIEIRRKVHKFVADDDLHPEKEPVYGLLKELDLHMKENLGKRETACDLVSA